MKFLVSNLLLTIVLYFNIPESNSTGNYVESEGERLLRTSSSSHNPPGYIEPILLRYKESIIEVSYDSRYGFPAASDCKVMGEHYGVPTVDTKKIMNFMTRALINNGIKYCVVYETGNGVILGAKLPPLLPKTVYTGDPLDFDPDEKSCFMTYKGLDFNVTSVPHEKVPLMIELLPTNKRNLEPHYIRSCDVRNRFVHFADLYFVMYESNRAGGIYRKKIVGADIDLEGPLRPKHLIEH